METDTSLNDSCDRWAADSSVRSVVHHPKSNIQNSERREHSLRIALFTYSTKLRGSVVHTLELAEALHQLGYFVCVYALDKDGSGFDRPLRCSYRLIPSQPVAGDIDQLIRQRIREFVNYLEQDLAQDLAQKQWQDCSYDCYHAQDCISANALLELRQRSIIPHFFRTIHHVEAFNSPYLTECQDLSIQQPDFCFCVSQYWQMELQNRYHIDAARVSNGINLDRFSPRLDGSESLLRQQWGLTGSPLYLTVGGIEPRKNSIALLQAFIQVLQHHPQAQLVIAGGATLFDYQAYRDRFFELAHANDIAIGESLLLPGVIADQDLPALYRLADAFVFPSLKEGWGLVVLEAIASGLPVLTANQPPFTEFLTPQHALLIDPTAPESIAQAMLKIVHPEVAQILIHNSQSVCTQYTWETSARQHLEHYLLARG